MKNHFSKMDVKNSCALIKQNVPKIEQKNYENDQMKDDKTNYDNELYTYFITHSHRLFK